MFFVSGHLLTYFDADFDRTDLSRMIPADLIL